MEVFQGGLDDCGALRGENRLRDAFDSAAEVKPELSPTEWDSVASRYQHYHCRYCIKI